MFLTNDICFFHFKSKAHERNEKFATPCNEDGIKIFEQAKIEKAVCEHLNFLFVLALIDMAVKNKVTMNSGSKPFDKA